MRTRFLKLLAWTLVTYSVVGVLLHLLYRLGLTQHYCDTLIFGLQEKHLVIFTLPASLGGILFNLIKRKSRKLNPPAR